MGFLDNGDRYELSKFAWAIHYTKYLDLQEKGLRKLAFAELDKFILDFTKQDKSNRWSFIDCVNRISKGTDNYNLYMPSNLYNNVFKPEIRDWIKYDPFNPIPYKWSSDFSLLKKAVELDPFDQESLDMFYTRLINMISLNQHEIEFGFSYSGNPEKDLTLINESERYIENLDNYEKKSKFSQCLQDLKCIALATINKKE